jgi:hypothetical protein
MVMAVAKAPSSSKSKSQGGGASAGTEQQLKSAIDILQHLLHERGNGATSAGVSKSAGITKAAADEAGSIQIWEDDPFETAVGGSSPVPANPIAADEPEDVQPVLKTQISDPQPDLGVFDPSSPEFRYWNTDAALARGVNFWGPLMPSGTQWSSNQRPLQVALDNGEDFNAFYARESGLNFFHGVVDRVSPSVTVFSADSPDVVCHELGHAILDAVKPELFDAMSMEVGAFHEAFGDMSATLCALQFPSFREFVLQQTKGRLNVNSRLSQLARQLGWAIRVELDPSAVDSDCLRNTCNRFFYQDPTGLPSSAPASQLSSEVHSFSRVFSGAFLDILAAMFQVGPTGSPATDSDKLEATARDAGKLLIEGVRLASVGSGFYSQVAAGMIQADQTLNGGRYRTALSSSFVKRGILSPSAATTLGKDLKGPSARAFGVTGVAPSSQHLQFDGDNEGYKKTGSDLPTLSLRPLATRFGVTVYLHMPVEPNRFAVAAAALSGGSQPPLNSEEDARSFLEDLIQRDRVCHEKAPGAFPAELTSPIEPGPSHRTHHLISEDGKILVKRHHFDCGFHGCRHNR